MSLSSDLYSVVSSVLSKTGFTATLVQESETGSVYNPLTGENTPPTAVSTNVRVVVMDYALTSNGLQTKIGTLIEANDKQCYMDVKSTAGVALTIPVSPNGDKLVIASGPFAGTWRIMNVKQYNPSGNSAIAYDLQLRK